MTFNLDNPPDSNESYGTGLNTTRRTARQKADRKELSFSVLGRYQILRQLGKGGFGLVYLALDQTLQRQVAIKVPRWDRELGSEGIERFLKEGRLLAQVSHPGIVTVHDYGVTGDDVPYVVMQFVPGQTLSALARGRHLRRTQIVNLLLRTAEALDAAHQQQVTHRDLKPSNIIVNNEFGVHIVDFGLALHDDLTRSEIASTHPAGTPVYMAPEQVRGENHLIDCRTDVWALGVIMYQLLAGGVPFRHRDGRQLFNAICYRNPRRPSEVNRFVPAELERICLRCLQKQMDDRYSSMQEVVEELRAFERLLPVARSPAGEPKTTSGPNGDPASSIEWSAPTEGAASGFLASDHDASSDSADQGIPGLPPLQLMPRGLRSFDVEDQAEYLPTLPGPFDRTGTPESLRYWMNRLNPGLLSERVPVGLLYGPSGCGKTSFFRAGVLPRLTQQVLPVVVDCLAADFEQELERTLRSQLPGLDSTWRLPVILQQFRLGRILDRSQRLLLVLDHFEQWLAREENYSASSLLDSLRQADGIRLQVLLIVREDFLPQASRLFLGLQQRVELRRNAMALSDMDEDWAWRILESWGRSSGRLPAPGQPLNNSQRSFLRQAVVGLSEKGKINCSRMSALAVAFRNRPWNMDGWHDFGSAEGLAREYVASILQAPGTPPPGRQFTGDAWRILSQLTPRPDEVLRRPARTRCELQTAAGLDDQPKRFDLVMDFLLKDQLLLAQMAVLPSCRAGQLKSSEADKAESESLAAPRFSLAHDILISPLAEWGLAKQNETRRGRATIQLQSLANHWRLTGDRRFLPGLFEFLQLRLFAERTGQKSNAGFLKVAARRVGKRVAFFAGVMGLLASTFWILRSSQQFSEHRLTIARFLESPAAEIAEFWPTPEIEHPQISRLLRRTLDSNVAEHRFRAAAALLSQNHEDPQALDDLVASLGQVSGDEAGTLEYLLDRQPGVLLLPELAKRCPMILDPVTRARLAITLTSFGRPETTILDSQLQANPERRTQLILQFAEWKLDLETLIDQLETKAGVLPGDFASALCCGLALRPVEEIPGELKDRVGRFAAGLFRTHPHAGTHSAAWFLLNKWHQEIPAVDHARVPDADWKHHRVVVGSTGNVHELMLVRVPAGSLQRPVDPDSIVLDEPDQLTDTGQEVIVSSDELWVSAFEVSQFLFDDFRRVRAKYTTESDRLAESDSGEACDLVSIPAAFDFCNWLSQQAGLEERYSMETEEIADADAETSGFRLLTSNEFEYAHRAMAETLYHFGNDKDLVTLFSGPFGRENIGPSGQSMPNGFGLFDMASNYREWTETPFRRKGWGQDFHLVRSASAAGDSDERRCNHVLPMPVEREFREASLRVVLVDRLQGVQQSNGQGLPLVGINDEH